MILAFDTSVNACSVALLKNGSLVFEKNEIMARGQAEKLLVFIKEALKQTNTSFNDIDCFCVTVGPGSFTGVRTGLSTAKSLGLALEKPVFAVPTTQAVAFNVKNNQNQILIVQETKRADFYFHIFDENGNEINPANAAMANDISKAIENKKEYILAGDGVLRFLSENMLSKSDFFKTFEENTINPYQIGVIGQMQKENLLKKYNIEPIYVRAPDVNCKTK